MHLVLIMLTIGLCILGCHILSDNGGLTQSNIKRGLACTILAIGMAFCSFAYGAVSGVFVYLGILSLVGVVYSIATYKAVTKSQKNTAS